MDNNQEIEYQTDDEDHSDIEIVQGINNIQEDNIDSDEYYGSPIIRIKKKFILKTTKI